MTGAMSGAMTESMSDAMSESLSVGGPCRHPLQVRRGNPGRQQREVRSSPGRCSSSGMIR
jgi:hypothetical protein